MIGYQVNSNEKKQVFFIIAICDVCCIACCYFFSWPGRVKVGEESIRDAAKNEVDNFFSFIIKRIMLEYMIYHVFPLRRLLWKKIF